MKQLQKRFDPMGFIIPTLLLIVWCMASKCNVPSYLLPKPYEIAKVMVDYATGILRITPYSGRLLENLLSSSLRVTAGFGIALAFGLPMGFITGRFPATKRIVDPIIHAIKTIPGIGWLPIAIVWFGVGQRTTIFLISLAAFFPIYINTAHGASKVPLLLIRAGKMLGAEGLTLFTTVIIPSALPSVIIGLRQGLGVSWGYLVLGELTGVSTGLGAVMMDARLMGETTMVIVSMIYIAIFGTFSDYLLLLIFDSFYVGHRGE